MNNFIKWIKGTHQVKKGSPPLFKKLGGILLGNQYLILLTFMASGGIVGVIFDIFRIRRRFIKLPDLITYIEDILFWIITGIILVILIFYLNDDDIRLYHFLVFSFGIVIYFAFISKFIFNLLNKSKKL